jgi:Natural resistance-associated macrophage protein
VVLVAVLAVPVPVLAGARSAGLTGLLGRPWGLSTSIRKAPLFYALLAAGTLRGTALTFTSIDPIKLLVFVAIVNGIAAVPFLLVVMLIARNRQLMGKYRNRGLATILGWFTVALMAARRHRPARPAHRPMTARRVRARCGMAGHPRNLAQYRGLVHFVGTVTQCAPDWRHGDEIKLLMSQVASRGPVGPES